MSKKLIVGLVGLGRIGKIHLANLLVHRNVQKVSICDSSESDADYPGLQFYDTYEELIQNEKPDVLFICSPTPSHFAIILKCCEESIDVFCEKPIDLDINKILVLQQKIKEHNILLQVGFNRRFDPDFSLLQRRIESGTIGDLHQITITSRDPGLPSMDYIASSGGMFMDMTIHDFDMSRFLTGSEVTEVYANGQIRIDQRLEEYDDIDTATTILSFKNGATCTILNSREACYGYDQRIEVFGSKGMLSVDNHLIDHIKLANGYGCTSHKPVPFFLERYANSYKNEIEQFVETVIKKESPAVTIDDALKATIIASGANQSLKTQQKVLI